MTPPVFGNPLFYNWRPPDPAGTRYNKRHNTVPHIIPLRILICIDTYQLICGLSYGPEAKSLWFRNNSKIPSQKNQPEILLLNIFLLLPTAKVEYLVGLSVRFASRIIGDWASDWRYKKGIYHLFKWFYSYFFSKSFHVCGASTSSK